MRAVRRAQPGYGAARIGLLGCGATCGTGVGTTGAAYGVRQVWPSWQPEGWGHRPDVGSGLRGRLAMAKACMVDCLHGSRLPGSRSLRGR